MAGQIDPKELKTLSDILALVLEDQPGPATTALETLRRRARQDGTTGGALKNLFRQVASPGFRSGPGEYAGRAAAPDQLRAALQETRRRYVEAALQLERERKETARLRDRLDDLGHAPAGGRVGDLERQLRRAEQLEADLGRTRAELDAARATLARRATPPATPPSARVPRRWQVRLVGIGLLGLLAADQGAWPDAPRTGPVVACTASPPRPRTPTPVPAAPPPGAAPTTPRPETPNISL